jgi:hypothetical protein
MIAPKMDVFTPENYIILAEMRLFPIQKLIFLTDFRAVGTFSAI